MARNRDLFRSAVPDTTWPMKAPEILCVDKTLAVRFAAEQAVLSWSLTRPGFVRADTIAWLEVSETDLPIGADPAALLGDRLAAAGYGDAVQFMTSRDVKKHHQAVRESGEATAFCLATVGLANAGRVGADTPRLERVGTINLVAHVDQPLDEAGLIESLSIATEARTAAIIDLGRTRDGLVVTGTGTDCIAVACPVADRRQTYAGLHADVGRAIGGAVYEAVLAGGREWVGEKTDGRQGSKQR